MQKIRQGIDTNTDKMKHVGHRSITEVQAIVILLTQPKRLTFYISHV